MYKTPKFTKTTVSRNVQKEGEPMHLKIERLTNNKELDKLGTADTKPLIYTEKSAGVVPQTDWRTDKWEKGAETSTKLARDYINDRTKRAGKGKKDGKTESTAGKEGETSTGEKP